MNIRKGVKEDMPAVLELIKELATFENEPDAVVVTANDLVRDGFGTNPLFNTFVAEDNGKIIGMALFYFRYSTWKGRTIHLEDLIVTESRRCNGVGSMLYKEVFKFAKEQGVKRVEWAVLHWNTLAISFYEKSGATVFTDWRVAQMSEEGITNFTSQLV